MKQTLIKDNITSIQVLITKYDQYKSYIDGCILLYGGKETERNSRYIYFEVYANLLTRGEIDS